MPRRFIRGLAAVVSLTLGRSAAAQTTCAGTDGGRVALTVGAFAAVERTVIAVRAHAWWLDDPSAPFHIVWGTSASGGQNVVLHAVTAYQAAQVATIAFDTVATLLDQIHVPLPGLRVQTGQLSLGVY